MGDFNEDGHTDLVTANFYSDSVGILLGYGDGTFQNAVTYPSDGSNPSSVSVGDFNGDGYADLVTANVNSSTVGVLLGNGNGTFQNAVTYPSGGSNPRSVSVGDFNEDGHTDLVTVNSYSNSVSVLLGNGDGTFQNAVTYPSDGSNPSSVSVGDFNEDGHTDLVTANYISGTVGVLLGGSNATTVTVTSPAVVVTGQSVPFTITVAPVVSDLGTASGTVTLYNGGTVLGTGTLDGTGSTSIVVSPLPVGTYNNITAVYDGDATLAGNTSSPVTLTVNKADTTVSLRHPAGENLPAGRLFGVDG
ncbi:MAG: FG-GAP-like repeat-containing protein, partial [Bacteroidales bacterium]|nr:FG-GAP-like repeat-containing protein [Bacteroidales bacterium]